MARNKSFPIIFCIFAFIVFLIPGQWLAPVELLIISPINLFAKPPAEEVKTTSKKEPAETKTKIPATDELREVEKELSELKAEYQILANENRELKDKLHGLADFMETQPSALRVKELYDIIIANVIISADSTSWHRSITLDRGSSSGIAAGLPVVHGKYLVGTIEECGPFNSRVQLLTDPRFRTKAFTVPPLKPKEKGRDIAGEATGKTEKVSSPKSEAASTLANGVLEGRSTRQCVLRLVSRDVPVKPDWVVFSASDQTGLYPRGLIIGKVTSVDQESYFYRLTIAPDLDLNGLASVLVLKRK